MNKSVVFLFGGIGNQLFQIAHALQFYNFSPSEFAVNDDFCKCFSSPRSSVLELFPEMNDRFIRISMKSIELMSFFSIHPKIQVKILSLLHSRETITDRNMHLSAKSNHYPHPLFHYGYFQYNREHLIDSIKSLGLQNQHLTDKYGARSDNECAVHIRRGDFLSSKSHNTLPVSYYIKAVRLNIEVGILSYSLYGVGSEYIHTELVNTFPSATFKIISGKPDQDFFEISSFLNHIGSNSTFSIWAIFHSFQSTHRHLRITIPKDVASFFSSLSVRVL